MQPLTIAGWALIGCAAAAALRPIAIRLAPADEDAVALRVGVVPELAAAVLAAIIAWRFHTALETAAFVVLAAIGVWLAAIDLRIGRLPNLLLAIGYLLTCGFLVTAATVGDSGAMSSLGRAGVSLLATAGAYGMLYLLLPGQLGGGDVKLAGLLGFATGWVGWNAVVTASVLTWLAAAVVVLVRRAGRLPRGRDTLALGPFLVAGAFTAVILAGSELATA